MDLSKGAQNVRRISAAEFAIECLHCDDLDFEIRRDPEAGGFRLWVKRRGTFEFLETLVFCLSRDEAEATRDILAQVASLTLNRKPLLSKDGVRVGLGHLNE